MPLAVTSVVEQVQNNFRPSVTGDIERLRTSKTKLAQRWRIALRETLRPLLADGAQITGFDKEGWYVVRRDS